MSASVFVVDSAARRTQIKVTPGKVLREVLEEACRAKKLNPESYALKTQNNKPVDLSQPFRLSGLSPGAKLQLTQASRSTGVVSVALQLPESDGGGRFTDKFPSNTSLWLVLRKFEEGVAGQPQRKLNLTQRAVQADSGALRLFYEQPSINVMGRTIETFTDLQKTLAQLGINGGSMLMRLNFKKNGQPLEEAMEEITGYFTSVDGPSGDSSVAATQEAHGAHAGGAGNMSSLPDAAADNAGIALDGSAGPEPNDEDVEMTSSAPVAPVVEDDVIASSSETQPQSAASAASAPAASPEPAPQQQVLYNGVAVYRAPSNDTPAAALEADDPSTFEPSIAHAKAHQAALERSGRNTRLLSDRELEEQEAQRQAALATVQNVTVRVRYPDQSMIETTVNASETSADVYRKVRETLAHPTQPFELRFLGKKGNQSLPDSADKRLVRDFGFRGKVLVTFAWLQEASIEARQAPALKEEYRSHAQELNVDLSSFRAVPQAEGSASAQKPEGVKKESSGKGKGGDLEAKMKKFLGFGKK
jgi:tether containing UBX domain for GLUT4